MLNIRFKLGVCNERMLEVLFVIERCP